MEFLVMLSSTHPGSGNIFLQLSELTKKLQVFGIISNAMYKQQNVNHFLAG